MIENALQDRNPATNFWELSDIKLARSCRLIAKSRFGLADRMLPDEAMRLFLLWREAIDHEHKTAEEKEQRVQLLAGLRKRTIQVLVRLSLHGYLFIP